MCYVEPVPVRKIENPYAVQRPHASVDMLERQGSFRGFTRLAESSPFKRNISLRLNELPSTLERQRQVSGGILGPQQYGAGATGPSNANTSGKQSFKQLIILYLMLCCCGICYGSACHLAVILSKRLNESSWFFGTEATYPWLICRTLCWKVMLVSTEMYFPMDLENFCHGMSTVASIVNLV